MEHIKCDHIKYLITLTSDYIKRFSLHPVGLTGCNEKRMITATQKFSHN